MLAGLLQLLLFHLLGYYLVILLNLPIPAPVAGLVLLLAYLLATGSISEDLAEATGKLLPFLPLFLIPASAGVIQYGDILAREWLPMSLAVVISSVAAFIATPFIFRFYQRLLRKS